jgi:hypothetical protein
MRKYAPKLGHRRNVPLNSKRTFPAARSQLHRSLKIDELSPYSEIFYV